MLVQVYQNSLTIQRRTWQIPHTERNKPCDTCPDAIAVCGATAESPSIRNPHQQHPREPSRYGNGRFYRTRDRLPGIVLQLCPYLRLISCTTHIGLDAFAARAGKQDALDTAKHEKTILRSDRVYNRDNLSIKSAAFSEESRNSSFHHHENYKRRRRLVSSKRKAPVKPLSPESSRSSARTLDRPPSSDAQKREPVQPQCCSWACDPRVRA